MCGICGIALAGSGVAPDGNVLRRMNDALTHRGPDDAGVLICGPAGLAMRRLSIIDVAGGHQPISSADGAAHIVFNGEIYNYQDLRQDLARQGHRFHTHSDTEVALEAYRADGPAFLARLRGMFALAIWDRARQCLVIAVDRFGIKPLYYTAGPFGLAFASELPSLLASERVARALDDEALAEYFTLGYIPAPSTALRDVWKLPPGHLLIWSASGGVRTERYWRPPPVTAGPRLPDSDVRAALRRQLDESVRAHLVSDVPVGAFLSGGIDSGAVVALMAGASRRPVRTFTAGFRDRAHDERRLARLVADRYGTDHNELVIEPESVDILPELVRHLGEPFADSSALPMFFISRLARRYVKVALSGDGGDELFLGYTYFRGVDLAYRLRPGAKALRALVAAAPSSLPPPASPALNDRLAAWRKRAADSLLAPFDAYRSKSTLVGLAAVGEALTPAFRARLADGRPYRALDAALQRPGAAGWSHPLEPVVRAAQTVSLPGDMLVKVDRMSMANSLEVRVPFVDHVLAEYVATIPIGQRFPRWRLKGLLKDSVADLLPEEVLRRPKHGFTAPLSSWVRGDIGGYAAAVLLDGRARARGLYDPAGVVALLRRHRERGGGLGAALWALLVFEMWCQVVLD